MIPVRMESARLPNKALAKIQGISMILHTWKRCSYADKLDDLFVVTDSLEIRDLVTSFGGKVLMTRSDHLSGSDRIAEASLAVDAEIIVNIQGDEALVSPDHINQLVCHSISSLAPVSILTTKFNKRNSPSDVKVVLDCDGNIMYASRADIPYSKVGAKIALLKAYHVVAFRKDFLSEYTNWPPSKLELIEGNEYLRVIERGRSISTVLVSSDAISVDTEEDLKFVDNIMIKDPLFATYKDVFQSKF
jgi:3-deoxy-manno-octulosonate cytidylyltransferase (CMP-KDO synthetase)